MPDSHGGAGTFGESSQPLLQHQEEHDGDDPNDGLAPRSLPRSAKALSVVGRSFVHISKRLFERIEENNKAAVVSGGPIVDTAPLPARAQFLNVIESIFSGMARAIIHNSNYRSVEEAKGAINLYFDERNRHFREHPRRAGKRIWGKERVPSEFADGNCCKDPRFR
jgi:hypothetical protein